MLSGRKNFFSLKTLGGGGAECLICGREVTLRRFNIERHYRSCHRDFKEKRGEERTETLLSYKKTFFEKMATEYAEKMSTTTVAKGRDFKEKPTLLVALALAKQCRPFTDAEFFRNLSVSVLDCFGNEGKQCSALMGSLPLSKQTISRRTEDIGSFLYANLKNNIAKCKYFSICLDETTDINDLSQLLICVRTVDQNFQVTEDVGGVCSLHGNVTGKILFDAVNGKIFSFANLQKLSSICTDGARVMTGKKEGFVGHLIRNNINVPCFHCIIHQQALFSKALGMMQSMTVAVKVINKIRGGHNSLKHRQFVSFLKDLEADYGDLLLFTEIRWLSRGRSLERLLNLRKEVVQFLEGENSSDGNDLLNFFKNPSFLLDLGFLCDVTGLVNHLNLSLQGRNKPISELVLHIEQFGQRIKVLIAQIEAENFVNMQRTNELVAEFSILDRKTEFLETLNTLIQMYEKRFEDFKIIKHLICLFTSPLTCNISEQDPELHEELNRMRSDLFMPLCTGIDFWKNVKEETYPKCKDAMYKLQSMFGSTYTCEVGFSSLKNILTKHRNRLSDNQVECLMRIKCCPYDIDVDDVIKHRNNSI